MSVCVCVCGSARDGGLHFPEAAVSGSFGVDSEQAPLGQGTLIFMSAQGNGITLFSVSYCACVRMCVCTHGESNEETRGVGPCFELCHFVISHCVMLSVFSFRLSSCHLCFSQQFPLYLLLWFPHSNRLLPLFINTFQCSPHAG